MPRKKTKNKIERCADAIEGLLDALAETCDGEVEVERAHGRVGLVLTARCTKRLHQLLCEPADPRDLYTDFRQWLGMTNTNGLIVLRTECTDGEDRAWWWMRQNLENTARAMATLFGAYMAFTDVGEVNATVEIYHRDILFRGLPWNHKEVQRILKGFKRMLSLAGLHEMVAVAMYEKAGGQGGPR